MGDHKQLPPTILNPAAAQKGLQPTLFERLARHHETDPDDSNSVRSLLRTQYRMHEEIMGFSDGVFYNGALAAHETVRHHTLADIGVVLQSQSNEHRRILDPEAPLVFVDTAEIEASERQPSGSHSFENPREAGLVAALTADLLDAGVSPQDIAVISPYHDQVDRIESELGEEQIEVGTVDRIQGREKEVVLLSLVRSNSAGNIGFRDESRRFNVALTRARSKVVVVGDRNTVMNGEVFHTFLQYAANVGRICRL